MHGMAGQDALLRGGLVDGAISGGRVGEIRLNDSGHADGWDEQKRGPPFNLGGGRDIF